MATLDVLILDDPHSPHARLVQDVLTAREVTSEQLNCTDLHKWFVDCPAGEFRFYSNDGEWDMSPSTTVWYRRLGSGSIDNCESDEAQLIRDEMPHVLLGGLIACGVRWIDQPFDVERAERKLFQLSTASRMHLSIPRSFVTNDSDAATRMLSEMRLVAKPLSPGEGIAPYVEEASAADLMEFNGVPVLLQELVVSARTDLRVVVIGSRAWTWRRQRSPLTIDWRAEDQSGTGFDYVSPHNVEREAIDLTCALGLSMSVQDWLETIDGVVFLEANPQGAWAFLDRSEEFIPEAIAAHLSEQSGETLANGVWPKPFERVRWDLGRASKAPQNDGATEPQIAPPPWASVAARSSAALSVTRRANDESKAGAIAAEDKAARLLRTALTTLAVATALIGYQLQFVLGHSIWLLLLLAPVAASFACLTIAAFEAAEIDRVGFYRNAVGRDLAVPGPRDPIIAVIEQEEIGRQLAKWSSQQKHTDLMQARAWFTRGLVFLLAAGLFAAASWAVGATDSPSTPTEPSAASTSSQTLVAEG